MRCGEGDDADGGVRRQHTCTGRCSGGVDGKVVKRWCEVDENEGNERTNRAHGTPDDNCAWRGARGEACGVCRGIGGCE